MGPLSLTRSGAERVPIALERCHAFFFGANQQHHSWLTEEGECPESKLWDRLEVLPGLEPWISNNSLYIYGLNERKTSLRSRPNYLLAAFY